MADWRGLGKQVVPRARENYSAVVAAKVGALRGAGGAACDDIM